jgi:HemY protein
MIRLFIFSLLAIVVALWVTLYLGFPGDPGYLLIAFGNYTFETSLFALLVAGGIVYLLIRLVLVLLQWINPRLLLQLGQSVSERRKANARSDTVEGLLYFTRGNWQSSYNLLTKSTGDKDASVVNYLAAAYAAHKNGQRDDWINCLEQAEEKYPKARSTINSLKAQLLFKSGQLEQSVAVLEQLKKNSLNDPSLLHLLKEVYVKLEDWQALKDLIPTLEKNKVIDSAEIEQIQMRIFMEELYATCSKKEESAKQDALVQLMKLWKKAPVKYREDEKVVKHYIELLIQLDAQEEAAKAIEVAVSKNWSEALVLRYGEQDFGTSQQQLLVAEGWLKARPANSNLLLCLGRISMRNELWGKAKEYYEASIKIAPSAEAYGELSRLLKHLGEVEASETYLQSYGDLIGAELPELPLPVQNKVTH